MANVAVGGGFENTNFYSNTVLEFLNIANIHVMRESLQKLQSINTQSSNWLSQLESTGWLEYIRLLLEGSCKMIDTIQNGASILVIFLSIFYYFFFIYIYFYLFFFFFFYLFFYIFFIFFFLIF